MSSDDFDFVKKILRDNPAMMRTAYDAMNDPAFQQTLRDATAPSTQKILKQTAAQADTTWMAKITEDLRKLTSPAAQVAIQAIASQNPATISKLLDNAKIFSNPALQKVIRDQQRGWFDQIKVATSPVSAKEDDLAPIAELFEDQYGFIPDLPTDEGLVQIDERIESGELPADDVEQFGREFYKGEKAARALATAIERLVKEKLLTRKQARRAIYGATLIAVTGLLFVVATTAPEVVGEVLAWTGVAGGHTAGDFAAKMFDTKFPPEAAEGEVEDESPDEDQSEVN
ncbi:hypothetical protein RE9425_03010 [Prescottella equi]|nr:hypothetical protein RE9425_03010 [Prescottella equi]